MTQQNQGRLFGSKDDQDEERAGARGNRPEGDMSTDSSGAPVDGSGDARPAARNGEEHRPPGSGSGDEADTGDPGSAVDRAAPKRE